MSSWGRCQNAVWDLLWGYEAGYGEFTPGLLHDLGWERVRQITGPIIEAIYPIAYNQGQESRG